MLTTAGTQASPLPLGSVMNVAFTAWFPMPWKGVVDRLYHVSVDQRTSTVCLEAMPSVALSSWRSLLPNWQESQNVETDGFYTVLAADRQLWQQCLQLLITFEVWGGHILPSSVGFRVVPVDYRLEEDQQD